MILLGSTGSIGQNALKIAQNYKIPVDVLVAGKNITLLNEQIQDFSPSIVVIANKEDRVLLHPKGAKVLYGNEGILEAITLSSSSLVLNALVGFIGLEPSIFALQSGKRLALANKESLVTAGWLMPKGEIIPVDSEHFSLWHLLQNRPFEQMIITASGGAFRDMPLEQIPHQNAQMALKHPNWQMGKKITIDSATMVNKLFEILEAYWLFGSKNIDALLERKSIIHALVRFADGSMSAHYAKPSMQLPISYALNPILAQSQCIIPKLTLKDFASLHLEEIDCARYPLWKLKESLLENPKLGVIFNASNEIAVDAFLQDKIYFGKIEQIILESLSAFHSFGSLQTLQEIQNLDQEVRSFAQKLV